MVERSLVTLAADRGVTICFADLDGAEGLWIPEERTILVDRALGEDKVNEVLEHELAHVDLDDGHAAIDAAVGVRPNRSARWAAVFTAAASATLVGGVYLGVQNSQDPRQPVTPQVEQPHSTKSIGPAAPEPTGRPPTAVSTRLVAGEVRTQTVTVSPSAPATPAATSVAPTKSPPAPRRTQQSGGVVGVPPASDPTVDPDPPTETSSPPVTEDPTESTSPPPVDDPPTEGEGGTVGDGTGGQQPGASTP